MNPKKNRMNTRTNRYQTIANEAILAMQASLENSGCTETEGLVILRIITSNLEKALTNIIDKRDKK